MAVADRVGGRRGQRARGLEQLVVGVLALQRRLGVAGPDRAPVHAAEGDARLLDGAVVVEGDDGRDTAHRQLAVAAGLLDERRAGARAAATGIRSATASSSGASALVKGPVKKSSAAMVRSPRVLAATTSPSAASSAAGSSAEGSANATLPTAVPRRRTDGWATCRTASANTGTPVAHVRRRLAGALAGDGADPHRAVLAGDRGELADPVDVDQHGRRGEPGVHQPDEALAARERPGFGPVLGEVGQCLVHAPGSEVGERRQVSLTPHLSVQRV